VGDTYGEEQRKTWREAVAESDDSGHGEQHGKDLPVFAESICEARNGRPGDQADRGSRRQHCADPWRPEPALMKKSGQEWGRDPEGREHCAVEDEKAIERPERYSCFG
jgi:hypothetical protein